MKNLIFAGVTMLMLLSVTSIDAQKVMDKGYLMMEITDVNSDDEQMASMLQMMVGSQTEVHFAGGRNLSTMNMMGGMVKTQTLYNDKDQTVNMLFDMMGQKMHVKSTVAEMEKESADQIKEMENFKIKYVEDDVKEIAGYKCVKTLIIDPKTNQPAFEMYVSRDIKASSKMLQGIQYFDIDGFPLELIVKQPQMTMTLTTKKITPEVDLNVFNIKTDGYPTMTFSQFMEKMGAMGGGGGFGF